MFNRVSLSPDAEARIAAAIEQWDPADPLLTELTRKYTAAMQPLLDAVEETEKRGPDDWKITVY